MKTAQYTTGAAAGFVPFTTAGAHKELLSLFANASTMLSLVRDHGHGRATIDAAGEPVGLAAQARAHQAAGAVQIAALAEGVPTWRWSDDVDAYIAQLQTIPFRLGGYRMFSAPQMGSCRMGSDPQTSVAGPSGELHDTPGVWIGDGSAFPSPSGVNPKLSIMPLAHRTAEAIAAAAGKPTTAATA